MRKRFNQVNGDAHKDHHQEEEQFVEDDDNKRNQHQVVYYSYMHVLIILLIIVMMLTLVYVKRSGLPEAKSNKDTPPYQFSEERARSFLSELVSLGDSRIVGSDANEELAPKLILKYVNDIQQKTGVKIETELQRTSGSFNIDFLGGFTSVYQDVQNILVLLTLEKPVEDGVLMISAHYDTAVGVKGAGDNGASVANMIEIMSALAHSMKHRKSSDPARKSVLFIFSGAEETILQASHGFISSEHKWLKHIQAFINLEAAGSGGRELMFQTTHSDLTKAYARCAPYPHASIIAQDIFQSGVIPSDTDFRIYAKKLHGMDFAFIENGYVYHTILDDLPALTPGSMQHYGSNVFGVTECLIEKDLDMIIENGDDDASLPTLRGSQKPVFFDFFGTAVVFSFWYLHLLNFSSIGFLALFIYYFCFVIDPSTGLRLPTDLIWKSFVRMIITFFGGLSLAVASSLLMISSGSLLRYYGYPWLSFGLYVFPSLIGFVIGQHWFNSKFSGSSASDKSGRYVNNLVQQQELAGFCAASLFWAIMLIPMWMKGIGSSFLPAFWILLPMITRILYYLIYYPIFSSSLNDKKYGSNSIQLLMNGTFTLIGSFVPATISFTHFIIILNFFIPVTGRMGLRVPGDIVIAIIECILVMVLGLTPLSVLLPRFHKDVVDFLGKGMFLLWAFAALFGIFYLSHGYSPIHPKRVFMAHVHRDSHLYGETSNIPESNVVWMLGIDYSGLNPLKTDQLFTSTYKNISKWTCEDYPKMLYCDMPFYLPFVQEIPEGWIIPVEGKLPKQDDKSHCNMVLEKSEPTSIPEVKRLYLSLENPSSHVTIYFPGGPVRAWSFNDDDIEVVYGHHFIMLVNGRGQNLGKPYKFWVETFTPNIEIAFACHEFEQTSKELESVRSHFPNWVTVTKFISYWRRKAF